MKKVLLPIILLFISIYIVSSQVPEKFNYQGVLKNSSGEMISNAGITIRVSLLEGSSTAAATYIEQHNVTTNNAGQFAIVIGNGTNQTGSFNAMDWSSGQVYLKTEVDESGGSDFTELSTVLLVTVPYALYAKNVENNDDADPDPTNEIQDLDLTNDVLTITNNSGATNIDLSSYIDNTDQQDLSLKGDTLFISNGNNIILPYDSSNWVINGTNMYYNGGNVGIGSSTPVSNLEVKANAGGTDALFQVINANNDTVFAVYPDGVKVFVDASAKGKVGGFAVSGRSPSKAGEVDILKITLDSTRIYVSDTIGVKGKVGGFAVSGRSPSKGISNDYLVITGDSTRIYVNDTTTTKGKVGGFAVSGRSPSKGISNDYIRVTKDSTRIYVTEGAGKGKVGGFAVSGRSPSKGIETDYFNVSGNVGADIVNNESRIIWYPKKAALLAGEVHVGSADSVGTNSTAIGYRNIAMGEYSQAMGYKTQSLGFNSTAIGNLAIANDSNAFAFGNYAHALGVNSFALGDSAISTAQDAYAFGAYSYASGFGSVAIGSKDRYRHDVTYTTLASGKFSVAVGFGAEATAEESVAVGNAAKATSLKSVAIGRSAYASADYATALSYGSAEGVQSFAMAGGRSTGDLSFSIGIDSESSGNSSFTMGSRSRATALRSLAMGGYTAYATGDYSTSIGYFTTAQSFRSFVIGYYNVIEGSTNTEVSTDPLFVIGNGVSWQRRNALVVYKNGDMELDGNFYPEVDNSYDIGTATYRWDDIYATNGVIQTSDKRLKNNIVDLKYGLKEILQLHPVSFNWIDKPEKGVKIGLIAQEVQPIISEVVNVGEDDNKTLGIKYSELVPVLIKGMQEQEEKITKLEKENEELKQKLNEIIELMSK